MTTFDLAAQHIGAHSAEIFRHRRYFASIAFSFTRFDDELSMRDATNPAYLLAYTFDACFDALDAQFSIGVCVILDGTMFASRERETEALGKSRRISRVFLVPIAASSRVTLDLDERASREGKKGSQETRAIRERMSLFR